MSRKPDVKEEKKPSLPYSYHTFLFPFLWNVSGNVKQEDFCEILSVGERWCEDKIADLVNNNPFETRCDPQEWRLKYAMYQYFTPAALDIICGVTGKGNVRLFNYKMDRDENGESKTRYVIEKRDCQNCEECKSCEERATFEKCEVCEKCKPCQQCKKKEYNLSVNAFRLKVYDTGIAVLVIEAENFDHKSIDEVNAINEYGRRVNVPFVQVFDKEIKTHPLCADKISIVIDDETVVEDNYRNFLLDLGVEKETQSVSWNFVMKPIQYLLDHHGKNRAGKTITTNEKELDNFLIKPCIDDRMFVCCLVRDDDFSQRLKRFDRLSGEYEYLRGCNNNVPQLRCLSDKLYEFLYIETSLSCQSADMKKTLLGKSIYDRWIDYGTIHGVTHHSIVCMTGEWEGLTATVINPFLTQLVEMAILSLVQRSHQLLLFDRISEIAEAFGKEQKEEDIFSKIENLQEFYVRCQDQILLSEITVQEQGIELYDMLQEQLYIPKNKAMIDAQMNNLRDVSNISHEREIRKADDLLLEAERESSNRFNWLALLLSVFAIGELAFEDLAAWINENWNFSKLGASLTVVGIGLVLVCLLFLIVYFIPKKKKSKKKQK